jgi:hypothetical protein
MKHTRWLALLLAGTCPLLAAPARAQPPRSGPQRTFVPLPPDGDFQEILSSKLKALAPAGGGLNDLESLRKLLGKGGTDLDSLRKMFPGLKLGQKDIDPKLREKLGHLLDRDRKDPKLPADARKALEQLLKKPPAPPPASHKQQPVPPGPQDPPGAPPKPPSDRQRPAGPGPGQGPQRPGPPPEDDWQEKMTEWFAKWAHRLEGSGLGEKLQNSRSWQEGIRELENLHALGGGGKFRLPGAELGKLGDPLRLLKDFRLSLPNLDRLKPNNLSLPSLPRPDLSVNLPRLDLGAPSSGGGLPGLPDQDSGLALLNALLWGALGVLLGLLLWWLLRAGPLQRRPGPEGWRLGPWPVDPAHVGTRADLVRAFEHLALLRLGQDARAWNHRDIAAGLGTDAAQAQAADELARLYEQARYAPGDGPLPAPDLDAARRNLCLLAGVATA